MPNVIRYIAVGAALTGGTLLIAIGVSIVAGLNMLLTASITLIIVGAVALALTFTLTPNTSGATSWKQFAEARGEGLNLVGSGLTGGRAGTSLEPPAWDTQAALNSALPLVVAAILLAVWFIS